MPNKYKVRVILYSKCIVQLKDAEITIIRQKNESNWKELENFLN